MRDEKKYIDISNVELDKSLPKIDFNEDDGAYELACSIFNNCNLRCSFCFQDHSKMKTWSQIREEMKMIPDILIDFMKRESEKYHIDTIHLKLWGGELFSDNIPYEFFDYYKNIYDKLADAGIAKVIPTYLTNGTFDIYKDKVIDLINSTNGILGFSYDPVDRFHTFEEIRNFRRNVRYCSLMIDHTKCSTMCSITLSKRAISAYLSTYDTHFALPNMRTDISYYTPGRNWKEDIPTDEDLYQFFKWGVYTGQFQIRAIFDIYSTILGEPVRHYCNCAKAAQYQDGKVSKNCALRADPSIALEAFYGKYTPLVNESNCAEYKNSLGLIKRGCLNCEYYDRCQKPCWISFIFNGYKPTICPFYRIYKDLERDTDFGKKNLNAFNKSEYEGAKEYYWEKSL